MLWISAIVAGLILLLGLVGPFIPYKEVRNSVCAICGSTRKETVWFGQFKQEEGSVSALETWLRRREPGFEPTWQHRSTQTYFVLGRSCGTAGSPEICQLQAILDLVVEKFNDNRIAALVEVLRHGSREEQRRIIREISDEAFAR
jgi:hypothetical protein